MNKRKKQILWLVMTGIIVIGISVSIFLGLPWIRYIKTRLGLTPTSIYQLITDGETMVQSTNGRTNILLLGIGGEGHEGSDLTDTIIIVSFDLAKKTVTLISIPRDLWSDDIQDKINSAYHYGEEKEEGGGLSLAASAIERIVGIPIHYSMVIDFSQFEKLIDYIGGIDVVVPVGFTDTTYPVVGKENDLCEGDISYACRYQTVTFAEGLQHMDGKRALMYVRSRHADGEEGNDFARGRRQQDVLVAIKTKIFTLQPWYHPELSAALFEFFDNATKTNLDTGQVLALGKLGLGVTPEHITKISIEPYLVEAPFETYQRYALTLKNGVEEVHAFIQQSLF